MTGNEFNLAWASFLNAFPGNKVTEESQAVYWEMLHEIPSDLWNIGVRQVLATSRFFPTINEIGAACCGEQKEERVWREDPYRTIQRWQETIPARSWREYLTTTLKDRGLLPSEEQVAIEDKGRKEGRRRRTMLRTMREQIERLKYQIKEQKTEIVHLRAELREKSRMDNLEERRALLERQAKELGVNQQ